MLAFSQQTKEMVEKDGAELAEERKYILYEYLSFFWKKKAYFIVIPLLCAIVGAGIAFYLNADNKGYTAEARVFTGKVGSPELTDPDIIKSHFSDVKGLTVFVSERKKVKFVLDRTDRKEAEEDLGEIVGVFLSKLEEHAQLQIDLTQKHLKRLENRSKALNASLDSYKEKLKNQSLESGQSTSYIDLVRDSETELTRIDERVYKMRGDIALFERPSLLSSQVTPHKSYLPESIAIGVILGLIITLGLLVLLKYLGDAREYYKKRGITLLH
ncbi:lipopolysaccharide biosynthesis protein [Neobacillus notoginsengisoli]|uniref:Lipopolysaccharide biosynthesis protein n=1 Tax=Neobacillus notoginsengisoli TaxID=1578198 RepID=A0A417YQX9_9BACI|nr:lipopolysaccharide biosynthesis protein [Neobacillus notoginsengisoli]RHW37264.1 lipopolysaccharide biosynthesis protein [Neobacillus notoginsengisoli]